jgi:Ca2+-binding EF-hand superfamily protein
MRGLGLRVRRSVPVEKRQKMRPVQLPVAVLGLHWFLDRNVDGGRGHLQRWKGPRVQLVYGGVTQGMVGNRRHGRGLSVVLARELGRALPPIQKNAGIHAYAGRVLRKCRCPGDGPGFFLREQRRPGAAAAYQTAEPLEKGPAMPVRVPVIAALSVLLAASAAGAQDRAGFMVNRLDADQNGEVTPDELRAAKARQFDRADADGDGRVTADEFSAVRERMARIARLGGDRMTERALKLDRDGDGVLTRDEFTTPSPLLALIDADGNGAISRAEFDRARAAFSPQP